ncbi:MAG: hypothetical protein KJI72_02085 [Patescibacteria group bacterium]|nr:hypothetical protein [Patescibacteria group bacterium]
MIIFLYGPDSYHRNKKLKELIKAYQEKYTELDMLYCDLESEPDGWLRVKDFLNQPSMFIDSKIAVIKESGAVDSKEWIGILKDQLKTPKTFILLSNSKAPRAAFKFLLKAPVRSQAFEELKGKSLEVFLEKEAESCNLSFSPQAWQFFCSYIASGNNRSWLAHNELEKLSLVGFPKPVSLDNLRSVVHWRMREEVFLIARQILGAGNSGRKLGVLEKLLLQKGAPAYIFNSLAYQAGGRIAQRLADYDISIKSGGLEYEEALTDFVIGD